MDPSNHENGRLLYNKVSVAHYHVDVDCEEVLIRKINHVVPFVLVRHVPPVVLGD